MQRTLLLIPFLLLWGCSNETPAPQPTPPTSTIDDSADSPPPADPPVTAEPSDVDSADSGGGKTTTLSGRITLNGKAPAPRTIQVNKDAGACGDAGDVLDVVGSDGGVEGVVIEVKGVKGEAWQWKIPEDGFRMRQKNCMFRPSMLVVPVGQELSVFNDDSVGHNVNAGGWNVMQPAGADPIKKPVEGKSPSRITCNIHFWMEGWIYPAQTPFYTVTDEKGNYTIENIPPGRYRVHAWHPYLGQKAQRMELVAGKSASFDQSFNVPHQ